MSQCHTVSKPQLKPAGNMETTRQPSLPWQVVNQGLEWFWPLPTTVGILPSLWFCQEPARSKLIIQPTGCELTWFTRASASIISTIRLDAFPVKTFPIHSSFRKALSYASLHTPWLGYHKKYTNTKTKHNTSKQCINVMNQSRCDKSYHKNVSCYVFYIQQCRLQTAEHTAILRRKKTRL